jgi:uncharacterized protein (DUF58 family)
MRPTLRCLVLFLAGIPLSLGAVLIHPKLWTVWIAYLVACIMLAGLDALLGMPRRKLRVTAHVPEQMFIGEPAAVRFELAAGRRGAAIELVSELDENLEPQPPQGVVHVRSGVKSPAQANVNVVLAPRRRGDHAVIAAHVRWTGPLGLIEKRRAFPCGKKVGVVPNLALVRAIALRMFSDHSFMAGLKVERFLGDGSEYE